MERYLRGKCLHPFVVSVYISSSTPNETYVEEKVGWSGFQYELNFRNFPSKYTGHLQSSTSPELLFGAAVRLDLQA